MMTMGKGAIVSKSLKQKINTKSSTESELVALDSALPKILWCLYFVESQGYSIDENVVFQDNLSTMRLAINGSLSSSSRTKHIKAKYYFVKDKIDEGEVDLRHCPTEIMWSDVLNKPKQGAGFRKDRAVLMNVGIDYDDNLELSRTHIDLLPKQKQVQPVTEEKAPVTDCRSVLGDTGNRNGVRRSMVPGGNTKQGKYEPHVTWSDVVKRRG